MEEEEVEEEEVGEEHHPDQHQVLLAGQQVPGQAALQTPVLDATRLGGLARPPETTLHQAALSQETSQ